MISADGDFVEAPIAYGMQAPTRFSAGLAPAGYHLVHIVACPMSGAAFESVEKRAVGCPNGHHQRYLDRKQELTKALIDKADLVLPGLKQSVVMSSTATPDSFERYTGAVGGAIYNRVDPAGSRNTICRVKTDCDNLFMTGSKAHGGGGLPASLSGGWSAAARVLKA